MKKQQYKDKIQLKKTDKGHFCVYKRKYSTEKVIVAIGDVADNEGAAKSKARLVKTLDGELKQLYASLEAGSTVEESGFCRSGKVIKDNKGDETITYQYIVFKTVDYVEVSLSNIVEDTVHNAERKHGSIPAYLDRLITDDIKKSFMKK